MLLKAIETRYKGYRFRSRLEARWAVFFDALQWAWEYEPEGYELGDGLRYLPDFRLSTADGPVWVEVKPEEPDAMARRKAERLVMATKIPLLFCVGTPSPEKVGTDMDVVCLDDQGSVVWAGASVGAYAKRKWGRLGWYMGSSYTEDEDVYACFLARSARFEHGECGVAL